MSRVIRVVAAVLVAIAVAALGIPIWDGWRNPSATPRATRPQASPRPPDPLDEGFQDLFESRRFARLNECLSQAPSLSRLSSRRTDRSAFAAAVARRVERVRELEFDHQVQPEFVSSDELAERYAQELSPAIRRSMRLDLKILSVLRVIRPGREVSLERIFGDIAGFMTPGTKNLSLRRSTWG